MEYHSSPRFTHPIFRTSVSHTLSACLLLPPSLHPSVFVSFSLSLFLCRCVFLQAPGRFPLCSSQPFGDCALGLTDVVSPPGTTHPHQPPPHHLKRNHHPLACPGLRYHRCVRCVPASNAWLICSDSFGMHCVLKRPVDKKKKVLFPVVSQCDVQLKDVLISVCCSCSRWYSSRYVCCK